MPEGLLILPSPDLPPPVCGSMAAPPNGGQVAQGATNLEFAAIVDELLAAVPAALGEGEAVPVASSNPAGDDAAPIIADGNSLPPALPLALPVAVADASGVPAAPSTDPAPPLAANGGLGAAHARPLPAVGGTAGTPGALTGPVPALAAQGAATEPAAVAPTGATLQAASEPPGLAADKLAASPAPAPAPQEAALAAAVPSATHGHSAPAVGARAGEIAVPVRDHGWGEALGNRVAWLANQRIQSAELHLNPPQLGPIEVQIRMADNQASIEFGAHHALVRDAIESALPRLREMFAAQGLNLADVNVSQQSFAHGRQQPASGEAAASSAQRPAAEHSAALPAAAERVLGLVDLYA